MTATENFNLITPICCQICIGRLDFLGSFPKNQAYQDFLGCFVYCFVLSTIGCLVYLDGIVVNGRTLAEHNQRLVNVLENLEAAGLKLNPKNAN